eukprot:TRINITY_DN64846_c0_g1_i1.p1 TRINITY_DN64846_c0_g1~~TRINITY_DN64846_c0_g1_i1.p1  ORF type:complete len:390 (+),score=143.26 TRINITY_DN64846_c0_g1_i1:80-1171(+)
MAARSSAAALIAAAALPAAAAAADWPPGWKPGYPAGWDTFPGAVEEFPHRTEGGRTVYSMDPWRFDHRMGAYKILLASAAQLHFNGSALNSPLWGLPLQCGWQMETGRQQNTTVNVINATSWWGAMNYMLSVVPFIGAVQAGLVAPGNRSDRIEVSPAPPGPINFCTTYDGCLKQAPAATRRWTDYTAAIVRGGMTPYAATEGLWEAHCASLHEGVPLMQPVLQYLPSAEEQRFGLVWANLIDFVAALERPMTFSDTNNLQAALIPPRILRKGDRAPFIKDFTKTQNTAMAVMDLVYDANKISSGGALRMFQRLCCTPEGRAAANQAADDALFNTTRVPRDVLRLLEDLVIRHPCPETPAPTP